ncbi:winged helix-turn-helix transcriptional regulator [Streptomyces yaizuensis]|uniref:Helix-turn-helix transcriptional regulator n=1 Tax=Streptomyces yaizuensis TaxID=2989713 RepID=A0ABQ5P895_9ACTN|nr:helix-turn-helix domain-containing protein [Streptomyces sp. YSPA8]GLF98786.1 helix-turn-helix transcriptional regulator [Streptomyces sp. YSPA8]
MLRRIYEGQDCSLAHALEVVGERWSLLIVRNVLLGIKRFDGHLGDLGIARNVLTDRLNRLVEYGILERVRYQDRPTRYEYHITQMGRDLTPAVVALMQWGDRYLSGEAGPPRRIEHIGCEGDVRVDLACERCARPVANEEVTARPVT